MALIIVFWLIFSVRNIQNDFDLNNKFKWV